jgi:hypothetical protein
MTTPPFSFNSREAEASKGAEFKGMDVISSKRPPLPWADAPPSNEDSPFAGAGASGVLVPAPKPSSDDMLVANYCEQVYHTTGNLPTFDALAQQFSLLLSEKDVKRIWKHKGFKATLVARGIPDELVNGSGLVPGGLSGRQLLAANMMLNTHDVRSEREKLKELGISSQEWYGWLRDSRFADYLRSRSETMFGASDYKAYQKLTEKVEDGDMSAIKLHMEMRNIYTPRSQVSVNVQGVMVQLVDIISRHVKDKDVLTAIATDIKELNPTTI